MSVLSLGLLCKPSWTIGVFNSESIGDFLGRRSILESGGQLEIAGKVVGRWGGQQHMEHGVRMNLQQVILRKNFLV